MYKMDPPYIYRMYLVPFGKVGENHSIITTTIRIIILDRRIKTGRFIIDVTKTKLLGTVFDKTNKIKIIKIDISRRIMGYF